MSTKRLELIRLWPFSYFWTCWKVTPIIFAKVFWLMLSKVRRNRVRAPTCTSMGLGNLLLGMRPDFTLHGSLSSTDAWAALRLRQRRFFMPDERSCYSLNHDISLRLGTRTNQREGYMKKLGAIAVLIGAVIVAPLGAALADNNNANNANNAPTTSGGGNHGGGGSGNGNPGQSGPGNS